MAASSGATTSPDKPVLLHGDLDIHIIEARSLPNMDMFQEHMRRFFSPCRPIFQRNKPTNRDSTRRQHHHKKIITSDPYVTVCIAGAIVARTRVITNSEDPKWDERFTVPLAHRTAAIEFFVKDNDLFGAELIGTVTVPPQMILSGEVDDWFPVIGANGKQYKIDTCLHLSMVFSPVEKNPIYYHGIAGDPEHKGVTDAYFPLRHGGDVTLYQDAHVKEGELPKIELENNKIFEHNACWEDICHAILEAHHLIYIVGWSIYDKVKLVREPSRPMPDECLHMSLGELLKYKSQEGVRICLLVWDDKTSHDKFFFKTRGMMQTHDEETRKFFKHSSVICQLSPRYASSKLSIFKQQVVGTLFTHHQKCVLVDTPASRNNRKITAFIGGLDLCDGRYDTPHHRLFQDLDTVFKEDLHQPTFNEEGKGPRQPWHDLHCKIEGPATYDILTNFEQRWRKATKLRDLFRRKSHWRDDALLKLERISWILSPGKGIPNDSPNLWVSHEENPENWHVQIFRSIDSGSVKGFPSNVHEASQLNLVCEKNLVIDKSIHSAYVRAIRSAQHFIYIENQYFLGSSFEWNYRHSGAANLVPMELALKIVSKIRARERFSVYVLIPLWPEGVPTSDPVQEILFWQNQTMQMMYEIIGQELKSNNIEDAHPTDYLNFYCLGDRENFAENNKNNSDLDNNNNGLAALVQKYRRFMIYIHSKGMIVDDEYVIMGSANINQRSLSGSRDTEIAMGAYQPHYTWSAKNHQHPHGQVYGYRMSLWAEHMGMVHQRFKDPNSLETVRLVNQIAETNWEKFTAEEFCPLQGHLLKYPIKVEVDGKVLPLPNHECFLDMGGQVFGEPKPIPDILTM